VLPTSHRIEALTKTHDRSGFSCGVEALDRYLKQQARQDADKHVAAPFVLVAPPGVAVLGYYTLAKSLPRYPQLPVTLLGRLAVDQRLKGQGMGEFLLLDALRRSLSHAGDVAAMAVVVDAKDEAAAAFYGHYEFRPLNNVPSRLYLPMAKVARLFA
jgi:predicted GNAT family N-acyltransferase